MTLRAIADALNARGVPTPRGGRWHDERAERCSALLTDGKLIIRKHALNTITRVRRSNFQVMGIPYAVFLWGEDNCST